MQELVSTPGMMTVFITVLVLNALSLLWLATTIQLFRGQKQKYLTLLGHLGNEIAWGNSGRILLPLYVLLTVGATITILVIFMFQPHLL